MAVPSDSPQAYFTVEQTGAENDTTFVTSTNTEDIR